jgi:anthranilate phosphoribosyltransferase
MSAQPIYLEAIKKLQSRIDLDSDESESLLHSIFEQQLSEAQIAALLMGLAAKGEAVSEVVGFVRGMRRYALKLNHDLTGLVDTAGTGGDGSGTFNISTCAAFVIAGAGIPVAKHGNRAMSGKCGSADVLSHLGVNIEAPVPVLEECLAKAGITFLFAPVFHPAMRIVSGVRRELGIRTLFNLLGPLLNPAGARRQIVGVFAPHLTELLAEALLQLDCEHALIFYGEDGLDEISLSGRTKITELCRGRFRTYFVTPEDLGMKTKSKEALAGGDVERNAGMLRSVLACENMNACRDIVLLNAAAGIFVSGRANSLLQGMELAKNALTSGRAFQKLELLVLNSSRQKS